MKAIIAAFILSIPLWSIAQSDFKIGAKVDRLRNGDKVFLIYQIENQHIADSAIVEDGRFGFTGKVDYPVLAGLYLNRDPYKSKLQGGETMDFLRFYLAPEQQTMTAPDSLKNITVAGSETNKLHKELRAMLKKNEDDFTALPAEKQKDKTVFEGFLKWEKQLLEYCRVL